MEKTRAKHAGAARSKGRASGQHRWFFPRCFAALFAVAFGLSLLTAPFAGPDEQAHFRYGYAVVTGQAPLESDTVLVPRYLAAADMQCWNDHPEDVRTCPAANLHAGNTEIRVPTTAANYPPLHYLLTCWPLLFTQGPLALIAVRFLSAAVFSVLTSYGLSQLSRAGRRGRAALPIFAALLFPTCLAVGSVLNPQALELGCAIAFAGLCIRLLGSAAAPAVTNSPGKDSSRADYAQSNSPSASAIAAIPSGRILLAMAPILVLWILARPVGPFWVAVVAVVFALALGWRTCLALLRRRELWIAAASAFAACLVWLWWRYLSAATVPVAGNVDYGELLLQVFSKLQLHLSSVLAWVSVPVPNYLRYLAEALLIGALIIGIWRGNRREKIALAAGIVFFPLTILVVNGQVYAEAGYMWQLRYSYALLMPILMLACYAAASRNQEPATQKKGGIAEKKNNTAGARNSAVRTKSTVRTNSEVRTNSANGVENVFRGIWIGMCLVLWIGFLWNFPQRMWLGTARMNPSLLPGMVIAAWLFAAVAVFCWFWLIGHWERNLDTERGKKYARKPVFGTIKRKRTAKLARRS
ncbi:hypothetical protein ACU21_04565 [Actinobaculum suis]|uniref:DUF2142 domain-containing protein n=1 Tax=Actinobaculum suis TaxID=1657 RepID=UPI0008087496|nr:DUF2142 domain-containing protein [Actinobaculum suis]OCA95236.1 hypothetical protein ACU21_04565 [Actinobaculum suis]